MKNIFLNDSFLHTFKREILIRNPLFSPLIREVIVMALLFLIAFSIRVRFQEETIIVHPIRYDAQAYFIGACNIHRFGVFSTELPTSPTVY